MKKLAIAMLMLMSATAMASEVELNKSGNVYQIPVRINDQITLDFVVDSGASDVQIPSDVIRTLIRLKTITGEDFIETKDYTQADGSVVTNERLVIKQLQVGDIIVKNVTVTAGKTDGYLLLGQSFLNRFSNWSVDNRKQALVLGEQQEAQPDTQQPVLSASSDKKDFVMWYKRNGHGKTIVATNQKCLKTKFVKLGYQFDAFLMYDDPALKTVVGCWSPAIHKAIWHRKHDGKEWVTDFRVNNTWIKS